MKPSYMITKKKSAEENTSSKELELESVSDCQIVQSNSFSNFGIDLYNLQRLKQKYHSNPFISYLTIHSLSIKIDALRQICKTAPLEILCVDETKLDSSFPNAQFRIDGYILPPYRSDRDGKMEEAKWSL